MNTQLPNTVMNEAKLATLLRWTAVYFRTDQLSATIAYITTISVTITFIHSFVHLDIVLSTPDTHPKHPHHWLMHCHPSVSAPLPRFFHTATLPSSPILPPRNFVIQAIHPCGHLSLCMPCPPSVRR